VQQFIDIFNKMSIKLKVRDSINIFHVKFIYGLLLHLRKELEIFSITSIEHALYFSSKIEAKLPKTNLINKKKLIFSPQPPATSKGQSNSSGYNLGSLGTTLSTRTQKKRKWCSYHKRYGHSNDECKVM
jgi:hypothetical protein